MAKGTGMMTDAQRIKALLNRQKPDRVSNWPILEVSFAVIYDKAPIAYAYNNPEFALAAQRKACLDFDWVFVPETDYAEQGAWEFGGDIKWPSGEFTQAPVVAHHPIETPEEAMNLKMPDVKNAGFIPIQMEFSRIAAQEKLDNEPFNVSTSFQGPFCFAANIPGPDKFCKWLIKKPEAVHHLLRLSVDFLVGVVQYWKDTFGVDNVLPMYFEPTAVNDIISPKHFEQFVLPYHKEFHQKILGMGFKHIFCHICGEHNMNLPYWAQIPMGDPGIVSIGHEVELETAAKYFPNDIILGNINPTIVQVGTPEEIYQASKEVIERGKKLPGGFIFATGCDIPPMASVENVMAMTRAVNDFGWYEEGK